METYNDDIKNEEIENIFICVKLAGVLFFVLQGNINKETLPLYSVKTSAKKYSASDLMRASSYPKLNV